MKLDFTIRHSGKDWVATYDSKDISAPSLEELDDKVKVFVQNQGLGKKGDKVSVFMAFDNATIPQWIRQYAQHYFNRTIVFRV